MRLLVAEPDTMAASVSESSNDRGVMEMALEESWHRSKMYGVDRNQSEPIHVPDKTLNGLHRQHRTWLSEAISRSENLYGWVKHWKALTLIADDKGIILNCNGDPDFLQNASNVSLSNGAVWSEAVIGTNAIGTCLEEHKSIAIIGKEHFSTRNEFLCCAASPIFSPQGEALGAVDISSHHHLYQPSFLGLIDFLAQEVESTLVQNQAELSLRLKSKDKDFAATIAIDRNGIITGGTRGAHEGLLGKMVGKPWSVIFPLHALPIAGGKNEHDMFYIYAPNHRDTQIQAEILEDRRPVTVYIGKTQTKAGSAENKTQKASKQSISSSWRAHYTFNDFIGTDSNYLKAVSDAHVAAMNDEPVLITGETGTGKELFSHSIHAASHRSDGPFVPVNCGAIPVNLIESDLFGYEKGAFTGAGTNGNPGKFELADNGTLFLDEIGELSLQAQVALLRVLQEHQITRVGGNTLKNVDIRLIAATNRDLLKEVRLGRFREDLYYRLLGNVIEVPPLRFRDDAYFLAEELLSKICLEEGFIQPKLTETVRSFINTHAWPGNIRELIAALRYAARHATYVLDITDLPTWLLRETEPQSDSDSDKTQLSSPKVVINTKLIKHDILQALNKTNGNKREAARILGISRSTLYRKMNELRI